MKSSGIGGQAVLEGVMMKNKSDYAVAVRKPDGEIQIEKGKCKTDEDRVRILRLPIIRGVVNFVGTLVLGMKTLTISASFYEEEEEEAEKKDKKDKSSEQAAKERKENIEMVLTVILAVMLAVGFFMVLPFFLSQLLNEHIASKKLLALIEGIIRIVLFVGYVVGISMMSDIKRVFMYHGAEHKSINCIENGFPLTVQNVRRQSKHHRRCGTSFLLIVMFLSILFFMFINFDNIWLRLLSRILIVPVIAGVSYEFIRFAGNTDNSVVIALSKPGMLLQRLTTREPDDDMIEVAMASVNAVFDWEEYLRRQREEKAELSKSVKSVKTKDKSGKKADKKEKRQKKNISEEDGRSAQKHKETITEKDNKKKNKKSRAAQREELARREEEYRKRATERAKRIKEQEEREAELERLAQQAMKNKAARHAMKIEKQEEDDEILANLDFFFDDKETGKNGDINKEQDGK